MIYSFFSNPFQSPFSFGDYLKILTFWHGKFLVGLGWLWSGSSIRNGLFLSCALLDKPIGDACEYDEISTTIFCQKSLSLVATSFIIHTLSQLPKICSLAQGTSLILPKRPQKPEYFSLIQTFFEVFLNSSLFTFIFSIHDKIPDATRLQNSKVNN